MLFAQITDLHIRHSGKLAMGAVDTDSGLRKALTAINQFDPRPEFILITGDLVDCGMVEEYRHLKDLLSLSDIPVRLLLGNHDNRDSFREVFGDEGYLTECGDFFQYELACGPFRILCLDTVDPGKSGGVLCEDRLSWVGERLEADRQTPTVIAMHHPPFKTGIAYMDNMRLADADNLAVLVSSAPNIERVLCGHLHRPIQVKWAGTAVSTMSTVAHQLSVDLGPEKRPSMYLEPAEFQAHFWIEDQGLVSHTITIGDYGPALKPALSDVDYQKHGWG